MPDRIRAIACRDWRLLNRALLRRADGVVALTEHVAAGLRARGVPRRGRLIRIGLPPLGVGAMPSGVPHGGPVRVLSFGRLAGLQGA